MCAASAGRGNETEEQADGDGEIKTSEEGKLLKLQTILLKSFFVVVVVLSILMQLYLRVIASEGGREQNEDGNDLIHSALRYFLSC